MINGRIVSFGDSFAQNNTGIQYQYLKLVSNHFNYTYNTYGVSGSSIWDTFFEFRNRKNEDEYRKNENSIFPNYAFKTVVFVWSEASRFYHKEIRNISYASTLYNQDSDNPIWKAAKMYYEYLHDATKVNFEISAFFYWFDNWLHENYPDMKVIHMTGFPKTDEKTSIDYYDIIKYNPEKLNYYHNWKHSVEIRPPLLHFSMNDGWPGDLRNENRFQHLTEKTHKMVADLIIESIENYEPGRVFERNFQELDEISKDKKKFKKIL